MFLERAEGKRDRVKHQCVVASHALSTGDLAHNPGMGNQTSDPFGGQGSIHRATPASAILFF